MAERKPHRQICSVCSREYGIDFQVPDRVWELATHRSQRNDLICLDCFTRMADTRFVRWEEGLEIYPRSLLTHIERHRALILLCCDLHGVHCEPPAELCCAGCTEVAHPHHPDGVRCVLNGGEGRG